MGKNKKQASKANANSNNSNNDGNFKSGKKQQDQQRKQKKENNKRQKSGKTEVEVKAKSGSRSCTWCLIVTFAIVVAGGGFIFANEEYRNVVVNYADRIIQNPQEIVTILKSIIPSDGSSQTVKQSDNDDQRSKRETSGDEDSKAKHRHENKEKDTEQQTVEEAERAAQEKTAEEAKKKAEEEEKRKAEEKRLAEEKRKAEEAKKKAEEEEKRKAEEKRLAEEKRKAEEAKKKAEEEEKGKAEEKRLAEEKRKAEEAKKKAEEEEKRKAEEKRLAEEKRKAEEAKKKAEEEEKRKAEEKRLAEEKQKAEEAKKKAEEEEKRKAEGKRQAEEKRKAEEKRLAEEKRKAEEAKKKAEDEEKRKSEEKRLAEEKRKAEEAKKKAEEEEKRKAEEKRLAEEKRKAEEAKKKAEEEEKRKAEEKRLAEEKRKAEEAKKKAEEEERRKAEEKRLAEEKRKAEEAKKKAEEEEKRKAEEKKKAEVEAKRKAEEEKKQIQEKEKRKADEDRESKKEKSDAEKAAYPKISVTNNDDYRIRGKLDTADSLYEQGNYDDALSSYENILKKNSKSPRGNYGKANVLNKMAEQERSNELLEEAIQSFQLVLDSAGVPDHLMIMAGRTLAERCQFRGWNSKATKTWQFLSEKFPKDFNIRNQLGVSFLMGGKIEEAKRVFTEVLQIRPTDGFAKVHLGFILKTSDSKLKEAIPLMRQGIDSNEPGTEDGRFYFHLGDALQRQNKTKEAYVIYRKGAEKKLFLSEYQRSLYNVDHLKGQPWWAPQETGYKQYFELLEKNWEVIRNEGLAQLDQKSGSFMPEEENLREKGDWKQLTLYSRGRKDKNNCAKTPKTCELIDQIPEAKGCTRGQVKFSVMMPGVHVWPHCGPTNCRIRAHLGLVVPEGPRIRVKKEVRKWQEGKFIIFDDSFEHEVWHEGDKLRLVLIVDFWHPQLDKRTRDTLSPI